MESRSKKTGLSEHFTLEELTYSRTAVENAIANEPPALNYFFQIAFYLSFQFL